MIIGHDLPLFDLLAVFAQDVASHEIWSERHTIATWLRVEAALSEAQAEHGVIPRRCSDEIVAACRDLVIDRDRLWQETRVVGYPILPLINQLTEKLSSESAGRVHYGATTQDVMDTALALQLGESGRHLERLLHELGDALADLVERHALTLIAGRTHAQQAVPTTFGAKIAIFLDQVRTELANLVRTRHEVEAVSLFGAAGTSAAGGPHAAEVRAAMAAGLGLADPVVPWHVARTGPTRFGLACATTAAVCIRFAREVIDLSRTEVAEVAEPSAAYRGASSTMPQKANPIASETIIGFGVTATQASGALLRSVEAGHERAAGEWHIEWSALPTVIRATSEAVARSTEVARGLQVSAATMIANLARDHGLVMSEAFMMQLAPQLGRDRAHKVLTDAVARVRSSRRTLREELVQVLPEEVGALLTELDGRSYTGEAAAVCARAIRAWRNTTGSVVDVAASNGSRP